MKNIEIIEPKLRGNAYSASRHIFAAIYAETALTQNQCIVVLPLPVAKADNAAAKIEVVARQFQAARWDIGAFFHGHCQTGEFSCSSDNLSIRFTGVAPEQMPELAAEVCRTFGQMHCLLKRAEVRQAAPAT